MKTSTRWAIACVGAALLAVPSTAFASGFAAARFGGEHGNPTETNASTLYYNPAGIGFSEGMQIMLDVNYALRSATYDRPASAISTPNPYPDDAALNDRAIAANSGEATLSNKILAPMFGISSDLFIDSPLRLGFAFFAPFGGQAVWDTTAEDDRFPGASDGSQRWYAIDGTIRTLAFTLGAAYMIKPARLSIGLGANLYLSEINTLRARDADGTDDLETGGSLKEGRSWVETKSTDFGLGGGVLWEAMEKKLWIGASYQSRPNFTGDMEAEGTLRNYLGAAPATEADVILTTSLPDVIRLGARFQPMPEQLEIRLFGDMTRWSAFKQQCLIDATATDIDAACEANEDGSQANPDSTVPIQNLQRKWNDAFGVRLGVSYWIQQLEIIAGGGWDGNAVPDQTLDPALMDMNKFTATLGLSYEFADMMVLGVSGTNIFYAERNTEGVAGNESFAPPSRQPGNQGTYNQNIFLINTNLQFRF